jgi:hypothetical protein
LKIWLYGYYHGIRSTRKLEVACREQLSLLWLTGLIQPDHNSLWRFWRENQKALRQIFKQTVQLAERQALRDQIKTGLAQLQADGRNHYHPVEPEARRMKVNDTNRYAYNGQAVADAQEGIIVACEATRQENDKGQLVPLIEQARENLGVAAPATTTLADTGYGAGADLAAAAEAGLTVLVPPAEGTPAKDNPYAIQHFHYDPADQSVTCPQNRMLDHEGHTTKDGVRVERYRCHHRDCPVRPTARATPKAVRSKCARTRWWSKPCARNWPSR